MLVRIPFLKTAFENLVSSIMSKPCHKRVVPTPCGLRICDSLRVCVYSGRSTSVVCLEAHTGFGWITLEKSYPLSPKVAYRLVCSL